MEPRTLNNAEPLRARRSTLFSGDRYNNNGSSYERRREIRSFPMANYEPTPRKTETEKKCQICNKKFIRMFRHKKECHGCGVIACGKCFTKSCRCPNLSGKESKQSGFNSSVPLSLHDLESFENCPRFWQCELAAPTSIFRCRDREVSANLSIGEDDVINFRTQLTPTMSCSCAGKISQNYFQKTEFHFHALRNQKFSRWTAASFTMNYLAVGETWLLVSLSGMGSTFYGVAKIQIRRLHKFGRLCESLNIICTNEDEVRVRISGSFCWKIYNEEFDGLAPISSSPPQSAAIVSGSDRLISIELSPTLSELRSYYEKYLFTAKNLELKLIEKNPETLTEDDGSDSEFEYSGCTTEYNKREFLQAANSLQQVSGNSRTAMRLQIGTSRADSHDAKKNTGVKQLLRIIDYISNKYPNSNDQISLFCPLCTKPVLCLNKSAPRK